MNSRVEKKLHDLLEQGRRIAELVDLSSYEDLSSDWRAQYAAQKALEIIGEALSSAVQIDSSLGESIPDLRRYIDMRNRLTHQYWEINWQTVWDTCKEDVPTLVIAVERILEPIQDPKISGGDWFDE